MKTNLVSAFIVNWLTNYAKDAQVNGFIVGVSGGVDSALVSTLCAMTGLKTHVVLMPIHQHQSHTDRGEEHVQWLKQNFDNVTSDHRDLTDVFEAMKTALPQVSQDHDLSMSNTRSRLRMVTLYAIGGAHGLLVAGTGNEVEDYGIGFFTKYGDGGVDISPIGKLTKTQVWNMSRELGITQSIIDAIPSDGLWGDTRSDEAQIGAQYKELEWAMRYYDKHGMNFDGLSERAITVLEIYEKRHRVNAHKMEMPPVCTIPVDILEPSDGVMPE